jgi:hypothetical protein
VTQSHVDDPATTPIFPGDPAFTLSTAFTIPADFYPQYVQEDGHTGSHWGAPAGRTGGAPRHTPTPTRTG